MRFSNYYTYPRFNNTPPPPQKKKLYKETNYTHSQKPPTIQFGIPKKETPKSQAKTKPSFPQYPFLTIFNP